MTQFSKKIMLTGGGSGGHIVPLLAVAEELKKDKNNQLLLITNYSAIWQERLKKSGLKTRYILAGKLRRHWTPRLLWEIVLFKIGFCQSLWQILNFWPDVIFSKGGFVSLPVVLVGWLLRRPIIIHESDIVIGLTNRLASHLARKICVGFPVENYRGLDKKKLVYTGIPIENYQLPARRIGGKIENSKSPQAILVVGGSQGSHAINKLIVEIREKLVKKYRLIHICGQGDYQWLSQWQQPQYILQPFVNNLPQKISVSNLIIGRASATVIAEVAAAGRPLILIPLPSAAADHQRANARFFAQRRAALVLEQEGLDSDKLLAAIEKILTDPRSQQVLGVNIHTFFQPDAAELIKNEIMDLLKH